MNTLALWLVTVDCQSQRVMWKNSRALPDQQLNLSTSFILGLLNYYRKFIPHFSDSCSSLTCMTKPSQPKKLCWMTETDHAFHSVISSIYAFTVLVVPLQFASIAGILLERF